jgi:hypothetical protein
MEMLSVLGLKKVTLKMNITDEELLQRYHTVYKVAQSLIPNYPFGVLDELAQITPCTLTSRQEYSFKSYRKNILQFNQTNGEKK